MAKSVAKDLNDDKSVMAWLLLIQDAKERAEEWMIAIKQQQEAQYPEDPKTEKQPADLIGGAAMVVGLQPSLQSHSTHVETKLKPLIRPHSILKPPRCTRGT
jgi:hypothetical protein